METRATVSDVLVSLSTLIELKVVATADASIRRSSSLGTARSVRRYTSIVAMLGSIIPAPFAEPDDRPGADGGPPDLRVEVGRHDSLGRRQ